MPTDLRPGRSRAPGASPFVRSPAAGTTRSLATDGGHLQSRIQNDVSEIQDIVRDLLPPGGSATIDFGGEPMVLSRAAVGHGIALQKPHDFAAGNRIGCFFDKDAANESTIELDGEDIAYGNPRLPQAYGTVQALLMELKTRRTYF